MRHVTRLQGREQISQKRVELRSIVTKQLHCESHSLVFRVAAADLSLTAPCRQQDCMLQRMALT